MDIHRTFGEVVFWGEGKLRHGGRVDMTRTALEGFGKSLLATDEVVIEATGNCMAVSRVLSPFVKRVVIANPLQVKAGRTWRITSKATGDHLKFCAWGGLNLMRF
jgi:hypothetical protein